MGAPTIVQSKIGQDATDNPTNFVLGLDNPVTVGNVVVVFHGNRNEDPGNLNFSEALGNTLTSKISVYSDPHGAQILTCPITSGGNGFTVTMDKQTATCTTGLALYEISGWDGTTVNDGVAITNTGISTNSSKAMTATSFATDLLLQMIEGDDSAFLTPGTPQSGFAADLSINNATTAQQIKTAKQSTAASGTFTAGWPSMTNAGSSRWVTAAIAIKGKITASTPAAGSLAVSGNAPTLSLGTVVAPALASLVLAGALGVISNRDYPVSGSMVFASLAPQVSTGGPIVPSAGSLTLAGSTPSFTAGPSLAPAAASLALSGNNAVISNRIFPTTVNLSLAGNAPNAIQGTKISPAAGALALSGNQVVLNLGLSILTPGAGALSFTGQLPVQELDVPPAVTGTLAINGNAAAITSGRSISPAAGVLSFVSNAPTEKQTTLFSPAAAALTLSGNAPGLAQALNIKPSVGSLILTQIAGGVGQGSNPGVTAPFFGTLTINGQAATTTLQIKLAPPSGSLGISGLTPFGLTVAKIPLVASLALSGNSPALVQNALPSGTASYTGVSGDGLSEGGLFG